MSAPNTVTLTNNSGSTILAATLYHGQGIPVITGPSGYDQILAISNLANGSTTGPGTATVADGLADYWIAAAVFEGNSDYMILVGSLDMEPYKKCNSPDNGSTQFTIGQYNGSAYPVTSQTNHSDGSSDGSCSSALVSIESFTQTWGDLTDMLSEVLQGLLE